MNDFELTLFVGRLTRQGIVLGLIKHWKQIKDKEAAKSIVREIIDSSLASKYLIKHPDRILIP